MEELEVKAVDDIIKCVCGSPFFSQFRVNKFKKGMSSLMHGDEAATVGIVLKKCLKCGTITYPEISYGSSSSEDIKRLQEVIEYFPEAK